MTGYINDAGGVKRAINGLYVGTTGGKKEVQIAWVGDAGGVPRIWYQNVKPVTLTATGTAWNTVDITWTNAGADTYKVYRAASATGTPIYDGPWKAKHTDSGLTEDQTYNYFIEAIKGGRVARTAGDPATTGSLPPFSASAVKNSPSYSAIKITWTDLHTAQPGWKYSIWSNYGGWLIPDTATTTATTVTETGIPENTTVTYHVRAYFSGVEKRFSETSAKTDVRPVSTGYAKTTNSRITSGGYVQSSVANPSGGGIAFSVGGTMTSVVVAVWGHGQNGRVEPWIGGVARQHSIVGPGGSGDSNTLGLENIGFAAGTHSTGMRVGGSGWGASGWNCWGPYTNYLTQVYVDGINYTYYASKEAVEDMRRAPWWREELAEAVETRSLHIETTNDPDSGEFVTAKITDKDSGETLVNWRRPD